jgi:hypothetical protein
VERVGEFSPPSSDGRKLGTGWQRPPGYPNYTIWHYFTVIGYDTNDMTVLIADPAGFAPTPTYWLTFNQLAP